MSLQRAGSRSVTAERRPALRAFWALSSSEVVSDLESDSTGLSDTEAAKRLALYGPHRLMPRGRSGVLHDLLRQFTQPIVLILIAATGLSLLLGDRVDALTILGIVVLSGLLGFWQEHGASVTVARLLDRVQIHVEVRRGGRVVSVRPADVVRGDVVVLNAGEVVPCDCGLLTAQALQLDESALAPVPGAHPPRNLATAGWSAWRTSTDGPGDEALEGTIASAPPPFGIGREGVRVPDRPRGRTWPYVDGRT